MRKRGKLLAAAGVLLILCSLGLVLSFRFTAERAQKESADILEQIEQVLPPKHAGMMDAYVNMQMPVFEIVGQDFSGTVELPTAAVKLPIYSVWDTKKVKTFPCRFCGSVYDGSLIIGGSDQEGQFDCLKTIQNGSRVFVTDMLGAEFSYTVSNVERTKSADADILLNSDADLTLFAREAYSMEYIVVRCIAE